MIHHSSLEITRDGADAEIAFWALLGYAEIPAPAGGPDTRSRWLRDTLDDRPQACQIHLLFEDAPTVPTRAHVAIVRPAYDVTLAVLRDAGLEVVDRERFWGSPRAFVRSPAGHRVEVMAFAPRR